MKKYYDEKNMHELYGKRVRIYFNLHKKVWSIKDKKTNLVLGWCKQIYLTDCNFKVYESGRQRVLKDRKKNVHAYVDGTITSQSAVGSFLDYQSGNFTYNPYRFDSFVHGSEFAPIHKADNAYMWVTNANRPKQIYLNEVNL